MDLTFWMGFDYGGTSAFGNFQGFLSDFFIFLMGWLPLHNTIGKRTITFVYIPIIMAFILFVSITVSH